MAEPFTLEENEEFSNEILQPLMFMVDRAADHYDIERLRATLENMNNHAGHLAAFPFQETMDKADAVANMNNIFEKILELIELRIKQKEAAIEAAKNRNAHDDLLTQLGLN